MSGDTNIDITGSQFFIQVSGVSEATVDIGWLMVVNPAEEQALITSLFQGIAEELVSLIIYRACITNSFPVLGDIL